MISSAAANVRRLHNIHSPSFPSTRKTFVSLEAEIYLAFKNKLTNQPNKKPPRFPSLLCSWPWPWDTTLAKEMEVDLGYRFLGKFCLPDATLSWLLCFFLRLGMQMEDRDFGLHFGLPTSALLTMEEKHTPTWSNNHRRCSQTSLFL